MGTTKHPRANRGRSWVGALLVAALGHSPVTHAATNDSDRIAVLEQKLDQSLQLIRQLSARVQDLEAQAAHGVPPEADKRSGTAAAAPPCCRSPARHAGRRPDGRGRANTARHGATPGE